MTALDRLIAIEEIRNLQARYVRAADSKDWAALSGHRYRDYRRYDRPRHWSNRGYRYQRRCWTEWRHHRRVRVCR